MRAKPTSRIDRNAGTVAWLIGRYEKDPMRYRSKSKVIFTSETGEGCAGTSVGATQNRLAHAVIKINLFIGTDDLQRLSVDFYAWCRRPNY